MIRVVIITQWRSGRYFSAYLWIAGVCLAYLCMPELSSRMPDVNTPLTLTITAAPFWTLHRPPERSLEALRLRILPQSIEMSRLDHGPVAPPPSRLGPAPGFRYGAADSSLAKNVCHEGLADSTQSTHPRDLRHFVAFLNGQMPGGLAEKQGSLTCIVHCRRPRQPPNPFRAAVNMINVPLITETPARVSQ